MPTFDEKVQEYKQQRLSKLNVDDKIQKIAAYLQQHNIHTVVLGISGGVDSALVLQLLSEVKLQYVSSLYIEAYCINFDHVYGHVFERKFIKELQDRYLFSPWIEIKEIDCTNTLLLMFRELGIDKPSKQLLAQSSYALRYQMLFTYAQRSNAITFGTTNRDEMEYVGWFGKNSDMVVDVQPISNWHKFEVIEAAKLLKVPPAIYSRVPSGDLIDGTSDEDNFGCTYDELAYFHIAQQTMSQYDLEQKYGKVIELHKKNAHKYQGQTFNPIFIR